jgi:hypothetical protein
MNWNVLLPLGQKIIDYFWKSKEVKEFVVYLLDKYSKSTDNEVDDMVVDLVRKKLLG